MDFGKKFLKYVLTDNLYDLSQQYSVCDVRLQVLDQTLVSRLGKVVVGPVRVDLWSNTHTDTHTKPRRSVTSQQK